MAPGGQRQHGVIPVFGAVYYLRVLVRMYFSKPETEELPLPVSPAMATVMAVAVVAILYLGLMPGRVLELVQGLANSLI